MTALTETVVAGDGAPVAILNRNEPAFYPIVLP